VGGYGPVGPGGVESFGHLPVQDFHAVVGFYIVGD
jgi:hypothetical protein